MRSMPASYVPVLLLGSLISLVLSDVTTNSGATCSVKTEINLVLEGVANENQILASTMNIKADDPESCYKQCCDLASAGCDTATFIQSGRAVQCQSVRCFPESTCKWGPSVGGMRALILPSYSFGSNNKNVSNSGDSAVGTTPANNVTATANSTATKNSNSTDDSTVQSSNGLQINSTTPTFTNTSDKHSNIRPQGNITYDENGDTIITNENGTAMMGPPLTVPSTTQSSQPQQGKSTAQPQDDSWVDKFWNDLLGDIESEDNQTMNNETENGWQSDNNWEKQNPDTDWLGDNEQEWNGKNNGDGNGWNENNDVISDNNNWENQWANNNIDKSWYEGTSQSNDPWSDAAMEDKIDNQKNKGNNDQNSSWKNIFGSDQEDEDTGKKPLKPQETSADTSHVTIKDIYGYNTHVIAIGIVVALVLLVLIVVFAARQLRVVRGPSRRGQYRALTDEMQYEEAREPLYQ